MPTVEDLAADLAAEANSSALGQAPAPAGTWSQKYPIRLIPGATKLKVRGFCEHWGARLVQENEHRFVLHLEPSPRDLPGVRAVGRKRTVELRLQVGADASPTGLSEVELCVRPLPDADPQLALALNSLGPRLMESLRTFLYASPERRGNERWACPLPVRVYPVLADRSIGKPISAVSRNISRSGVQFLVEQPLEATHLYLHWYRSGRASPYALLAEVIRIHQVGGADGLEVGAAFVDG